MRSWFLASSAVAVAVGEKARTSGVNPVVRIVKTLTDIETGIKADLESQGKAFKKIDCAATKSIEANDKLIAENKEKISLATDELNGLGSVTLTDESQQLSTAIAQTNDEIAKQQQALEDANAKHAAVEKDLTSGISALKNAKSILSGEGGASGNFLAASRVLSRGPSPSKHSVMLNNIAKAAQGADAKSTETIIEMCNTLLNEFQKELIDSTNAHTQNVNAQNALISDLQKKLSNLEEQFENGAGEAAAKKKREDELNDIINTATDENTIAVQENKDSQDEKDTATTAYNAFSKDMNAQLVALSKAKQVLYEKGRALFQKVSGNNFFQLTQRNTMSAAMKAKASDAVMTLINAIGTFEKELEQEKKDIRANAKKCTDLSLESLRAGNQAAEQMDGFQGVIDAETAAIETEEQRQKEITESIAEHFEDKKQKNKAFGEAYVAMTKDANDLDADIAGKPTGEDAKKFPQSLYPEEPEITAAGLCDEAIKALETYDFNPDEKTDFHNTSQTSPFEGVIGMLKQAKDNFATDAKNIREEIRVLTKDNKDFNDKMGSPDMGDDGKVNTDYVEDPEAGTTIGDLEKDRNASMDEETRARKSRTEAETNFANEKSLLYGPDEKQGVWGEIKARQQQCDYWMVNGPIRVDAIDSEVKALVEARSVLSAKNNEGEGLGMDSGDAISIDKYEEGSDSHQHSESAEIKL